MKDGVGVERSSPRMSIPHALWTSEDEDWSIASSRAASCEPNDAKYPVGPRLPASA